MPIDVSTLPAESREGYLELGRRVTTANSLAQANKTILAFGRFGVEVTAHGYGTDDDARLSDARDTLLERHSDRSDAKGASKVSMGTYLTALSGAKQERLSVRTLLTSCISPLRDGGNLADANRVRSLLDQTSAAIDDTTLLDHMKRLHAMLNEPMLESYIATRGGPGMIVRVISARESLIAAMRERAANPEVSALSDERDILDGIIVTLTRNAARAARVAARRLGQPAIAQEFKLIHFRSRASAPEPEPAPPVAAPRASE